MASPLLDPSGRSHSFASRKAESNSRLAKVKRTIADEAAELLSKVDFDKSEIRIPQKFVFVCGGQESNISNAPTSLRELLRQRAGDSGTIGHIGDARVVLAEAAVKALASSSFKNLLDLEEYIAAVAQSVVLIVESPGSICELGAFVKTPEIREKLIVIVQSQFKNQPSFITNGAIQYLLEHNPDAKVLGYHWKTEGGVVIAADYVLDDMLEEVPEAIQQVHKAHFRESLDRSKQGHKIYLVLAFCHLLRAAKITDIKSCFLVAGIAITEVDIKKCIDTLMICKLLVNAEQGRTTYYVARTARMPLEIKFKKETEDQDRDTMRMISRLLEIIKVEEPHRLEMFRDHSDVW